MLSLAAPIPVITALVQALKEFGVIKPEQAKLCAFGFAILFSVFYLLTPDIYDKIFGVIVYALSSIGLWEASKNTYRKFIGQ